MATLVNADTGEVLLKDLEIADTFWTRFVGLQFRRSLPSDAGILLTPCSSLHTCWMRFSIDVFMLDVDFVVLGIRRHVRPWRAVICQRGTTQVIEVNPDSVDVAIGCRLGWTKA